MSDPAWLLYALRCADDTLYTGVTTDLERRVSEHNSGHGARYTAGRCPVHLIGAWPFENRSTAQAAEAKFRRLPRREKLQLVARQLPFAGSPFSSGAVVAGLLSPIRFCHRCGGLLGTIRRPEDCRPRQACTTCGRIHYRNAKPCAGALVTRNGHLLLVKRSIEPYLGHWDIPGGFLEAEEDPSRGAIREVQEETGLQVELTELLGFYVGRYSCGDPEAHCLNIYFLAHVVGGEEQPNDDAAELAWFSPNELPGAIAFEHARQVLRDWVERVQLEQQDG